MTTTLWSGLQLFKSYQWRMYRSSDMTDVYTMVRTVCGSTCPYFVRKSHLTNKATLKNWLGNQEVTGPRTLPTPGASADAEIAIGGSPACPAW